MRTALTPTQRARIIDLHLAGETVTGIARIVDCNPRTVERIIGSHWTKGLGQEGRCPGCGGKVVMPCMACAIQRQKKDLISKRRSHVT